MNANDPEMSMANGGVGNVLGQLLANVPAMSLINGGVGNAAGQPIMDNEPAMSLRNGGIGNASGQELPPEAIKSANKVLNKYYDKHAEDLANQPGGIEVLQKLVSKHKLNENPSLVPAKSMFSPAQVTPEGDIQQSGFLGSLFGMDTPHLIKQLMDISEINKNRANSEYLRNGGSSPKNISSTPGFDNLSSEQQLQALDMARQKGGVRGVHNFLPSIVAQMNAGVPIDQIEDKLRYSGQSSSMSSEWRGAAQSILTGATQSQTQKQMDALDDYIQKGDIEGGKSYLKRMAVEQAPVDQKISVMAKERTIDLLDEIKNDFITLENNGIDTNFLSGNYENLSARLGNVKNPEMRKIATKIAAALQNYRRSMTGAAFTAQESEEYRKIFPSISNVGKLNLTNINALKEVFSGDTSKFYEQNMGADNYKKLFGSSKNTNISSDQSPKSSGFKVISVRDK